MKTLMRTAVLVVFAVSISLGSMTAQVVTATLVGTVKDQSGAVVPGAAITIVNRSTGLRRTVSTNQSGEYAATALPAGGYQVSAERSGFKKTIVPDLSLDVAQTSRVDLVLTVGESTEVVDVS